MCPEPPFSGLQWEFWEAEVGWNDDCNRAGEMVDGKGSPARGIAVKGPLKSGNSLPFRELQGLGTWIVGLAKGRKRGPKRFQQYPWYPE